MKSLGTVLRKAIEQSGYSIYKVANKSGANRTTLQKILTDERPISADLLNQILSVLRLSPLEEAEILAAFEISQSGETLYALRQLTKHFLENLFNADGFLSSYQPGSNNDFALPASSLPICEQQLISGSYQVEALLKQLLHMEFSKPEPRMYISLPGTLPLLHDFLFHQLLSSPPPIHTKFRHITQFVRSNDSEKDALTNLNILSKLLPFCLLTSLDYQIHYFYGNQLASEPLNLAFPYYIIFSDTLLLLSADGNMALPCTERSSIQHFQLLLFDGAWKKTLSLLEPQTSADELLNHLLDADKKNTVFNSIEYQPCLITFFSEELFYQYAHKDLPNRDALLQAVILRCRQLQKMENRNCIFSKSGLWEFAATGYVSDLPSAYAQPLSLPDRILILKRMYNAIKANKHNFHMTNPVTFPLPTRLTCIVRENSDVEFCYFNQNLLSFKNLQIKERTILDAFEDFFRYALEHSIVYTHEETLLEISKCLQELEHTVPVSC